MGASKDLSSLLADLRERIARAKGRRLNEQNTKATLIEPLLRALGWDTEDVDEIQREYKVKRSDRPVDYALLTLRTPRLFLEAKALHENLDDRRWANQIMGYAGVAGVEWIVLTDGEEYRIYNSHAPVAVDEKLFRTVRITDPDSFAQDTLQLLAKDRMEKNRIEVLWRAQFVDRQVQQAIEQLFSAESDMLLVNFVAGRTKHLSTQEIRESIARCGVQLDFPVPTEEQLSANENAGRKTKRKKKMRSAGTEKTIEGEARFNVSLADLIEKELVRPPLDLHRSYKGRDLAARIEPDGSVAFAGERFESLSTAGAAARATIIGRKENGALPHTNGWNFWRFTDGNGEAHEIDVLRREFLERRPRGRGKGTAGA